jgi:hypothetical protein
MKNSSSARGWLFFAVGLVAAYAAGVGLVFAVNGTLTYVHLVPILLSILVGATAMSLGASGFSPLTKGLSRLDLGWAGWLCPGLGH